MSIVNRQMGKFNLLFFRKVLATSRKIMWLDEFGRDEAKRWCKFVLLFIAVYDRLLFTASFHFKYEQGSIYVV